jgi:hypothetical protein
MYTVIKKHPTATAKRLVMGWLNRNTRISWYSRVWTLYRSWSGKPESLIESDRDTPARGGPAVRPGPEALRTE